MAWTKIEKPASGSKDVTSVLICSAGEGNRRLKIGRGVLQQIGDGDIKKVDVEVDLANKAIRISSGQTYVVSVAGRNWRAVNIERALQAIGEIGPLPYHGPLEPQFELKEGSLIVWPGKRKA